MSSIAGSRRVNAFQPATQPVSDYRLNKRESGLTRSSSRKTGKLVKIILLAVAVIFILIGIQAYTATLQHANNILVQDNEYLQAEIDSIKSKIVEETKVTKIERIATDKYGMVYPTSDNCITIDEGKKGGENLAAAIKSEAYN